MTPRALFRERFHLLVLLAAALYFAVGVLWWQSRNPSAAGSNDTYTYVYPSFVYALRSLRDGAGFFWNPYQDCGQPFFAISQTALLYPVNWVAALLDREAALIVTIIVNLAIAGIAVYRLGREMELSSTASLCAALAFQLGGSAMDMAAWSPVHIAPYAWLAVAMWLVERLVNHPTFASAAALGVGLTIQLLPGFPQLVFFTYQLAALRVAWAVVFAQTPDRVRLLTMTLVALTLPLGLAAVQLLPSLEVARASLRTIPLSADELGGFHFSWHGLRVLGSMDLMSVALAVTALLGCRFIGRPTVVFYAVAAALYFTLALGPETPLFDLYARLPMGSAFRGSPRLLWVVGFALAVLTGCGTQALLDLRDRGRGRAWIAIVPLLVGGLLLHWAMPEGLSAMEWLLTTALIATAIASGAGRTGLVHVALPVLIVFHGVAVVPKPFNGLRAGELYQGNAEAFALVRARLTAQDRVMIVGRPGDYSLMPKSGMLFAVPDVFDYEPQVSRSYAEFFTYMRTGRAMQRLDDWYWIFRRLLPETVQPHLLDMMATRYLLVDRSDRLPPVLAPRLELVGERDAVRVYENRSALPRAFFVPRIVVKAADGVLPALVDGSINPALVAAVSAAPQSGFLGTDDATGSAEIIDNAPERVAVRVRATAPGFLYLADQIFPGWEAHVNGVEHEILRANHTFRLVEVPAGDSEVVFTYRSRLLWIGAAISASTLFAVVGFWIMNRHRRVA